MKRFVLLILMTLVFSGLKSQNGGIKPIPYDTSFTTTQAWISIRKGFETSAETMLKSVFSK